jgi:outer membrane protein W
VVRAQAGNWGFNFIFGGLATLGIAGPYTHTANRAFLTEVGAKYFVTDRLAVPFSIGLGVLGRKPDVGDIENDFGISATAGIQYYFRVWRRIAPFVGAKLHIDYTEPVGPSNYSVRVIFGPAVGVEYYVADRVSLQLEYNALVGFDIRDGFADIGFQTVVSMGGLVGLNFYF